jgi:hypothetical protein
MMDATPKHRCIEWLRTNKLIRPCRWIKLRSDLSSEVRGRKWFADLFLAPARCVDMHVGPLTSCIRAARHDAVEAKTS